MSYLFLITLQISLSCNTFLASEKALGCLSLACRFKDVSFCAKDITKHFPFNISRNLDVQREIIKTSEYIRIKKLTSMKNKFILDEFLEMRFKIRFLGITEKDLDEAYAKEIKRKNKKQNEKYKTPSGS